MDNIKLEELLKAIAVITSSEMEFSECEIEPGKHCSKIRKLTEKVLLELQDKKYKGKYKLDEEDIHMIGYLAMFHDIGKSKVPWNIVHKPEKLTDAEFEQMKLHTIYGSEIALRYQDVVKNSKITKYMSDICKYHHEKWDGNGYPEHLRGNEIPIYAQVVGIVDCYDVLISKRSYKKAVDKSIAIECIKQGKCGIFNPDVIDAFLRVIYE